ncbi:U11/U12 small nuclear ribonucleoprotein 35 kDa protein [Bufo gargarizans]|uniref:U11/U12 small nuclear ribonucleoprotein 35 kDa protein n=1 Tax=Bufo gargarizans TaxID=30331 RepID=UPI001CF59792|nr:U11/U12 small nuclear ribonucleoprotein 35 kDa protein [Bufo gargarizans]XP_044146192.1 U11/U12 small nuclear ribonucleoprotein 35 kDa protein [Bufo gargarizans]XP_044146200.1 U11/U12 small nuclear ribonucleoprotein 35 kDa protein [Bufo gargarizans]
MNEWAPIAKNYHPLKAGSIDGTDEEPHDRAVLRAMLARYVPNKGVVGDPQLTLFVARLSQQTTEEKLKEVFSRYGDIQRIRLVRDFITGFSKGYAFIEYKQEHAIKKAYRDANKLVVDQQEVFVDFELERTLKGWIPRRLGGGFGGKKESGQLRFGGRDRPFRKPINLPFFPSNTRLEVHGENRQRSRSRERPYDRRGKEYTRDRGRDRWPQRSEREHTTERHAKEERNRDRDDKDRSRRESKRSRERDHRR